MQLTVVTVNSKQYNADPPFYAVNTNHLIIICSFLHLQRITLCSNMIVRDVVTSNQLYPSDVKVRRSQGKELVV